ncbi:dihydroorotate dehydrogenase, partial [Candidatus Falkowbacteria bacterium]
PTIGASGCQSESSLSQGHLDIDFLGAINAKGLSLYPSAGNQPPRVCETPSGMLNAIGLENVGLEEFLERQLPKLLSFGKPVIVNIHGKTVLEYVALAQGLENTAISAIEQNISCPNVDKGMAFGVDKDSAYEVVSAAREVTSKFLIVKLTPNVTDHILIAKAVEEAGADTISLINTLWGMAIDIETRRPKLKNIFGGLSGPAIHPVALRMVYQLYLAGLNIPIIGVGGIHDFESALAFFIGGAKAVQVGTASFTNGEIFTDIVMQMENYMLENGFKDIDELSGSMIID